MNEMKEPLSLAEALSLIRPLDADSMAAAAEYQDRLLKPAGSLGELEAIAIRIAGITGKLHNMADRKIHFLLCSDMMIRCRLLWKICFTVMLPRRRKRRRR